MPDSDAIVVLTTAGSSDEAATIAASLVDGGLAACVQIIPGVQSVYRWEGRVTTSAEWLLVGKTTAARYGAVESAIRAAHSYETPEIVSLRIESGSADYLAWLRESVQ